MHSLIYYSIHSENMLYFLSTIVFCRDSFSNLASNWNIYLKKELRVFFFLYVYGKWNKILNLLTLICLDVCDTNQITSILSDLEGISIEEWSEKSSYLQKYLKLGPGKSMCAKADWTMIRWCCQYFSKRRF